MGYGRKARWAVKQGGKEYGTRRRGHKSRRGEDTNENLKENVQDLASQTLPIFF
jgi:hypothetical protein